MKVAIVQMKPRKGDRAANLAAAGEAFAQLRDDRPELVVLPEAALTGYFLEGAVYDLARPAEVVADELSRAWRDAGGGNVDLVCGFYENAGGTYYNSASYLRIGPLGHEILHVHRKMFLPTYGVFDEERFLSRGRKFDVFETRFGTAAILICEDAWHAIMPTIAAIKGARTLIIPSASPGRGFSKDDGELESIRGWKRMLTNYASEHGVFIVYAGLSGFEGGKGMSGSSCVVNPSGSFLVTAPLLGACIVRAELDLREIDRARAALPLLGDLDAVLPDLLRKGDLGTL